MDKNIKKTINLVGTQTKLAKLCGVSQPSISIWLNGGKMDVKYIPSLIKATNGEVTPEDLRPDVDWEVIRQCWERKDGKYES
ncbi:helix-turn-helix domain-containing protein [Histophilus somni]|uniref:helix-turn-helix domain-containing protein n=1 Tax=Histophilus somni TaxID=731 RepID=UPI003C306BFA